jgi:phage baseplate assembly protein W
MATTFVGFNTQGQNKKFTLTDQALIRRDLLNSLNIKQGQLPGRPDFGTVIWDFVFEPQTADTADAVIQEIERIAGYDPRIYVNNVEVFAQENGLLVQVEVTYVNGVDAELLSLFFDQSNNQAYFV